ncbi:MAG TPA: tetratricopeptide repeat protein, partial [Methylophilaceae bacterium]
MSVQEKLGQAIGLHQAGELESAKRLYKQILQASPQNADAQHNLGLLNISQGDTAAGLGLLQEVLQTHPEHSQYWFSYINALVDLEEWQAAGEVLDLARQHGLSGQALDDLAAHIVREPRSRQAPNLPETQRPPIQSPHAQPTSPVLIQGATQPDAMVPTQTPTEQLINLYYSGQYPAAAALAISLTQSNPQDAFAWKALGLVYAQQEKYIEAEGALLKAAESTPDDPDIYSNLGNVLQAQKKYEEATANFLRATELNPNHVEAQFNLGNTYKEQGRFDDAIVCYRRAIALKPDFAEAYGNLGTALDKVGQYQEAIACYLNAIAIKPDFAEAHYNLGLVFKNLEQYDEAIASIKKAIQLNPTHSELYFSLGLIYEILGDFEKSRDALVEAVNYDPQSYRALTRLGLVYCTLNQLMLALANLSNSLSINPDFAETHHHLGIYFDRAGYPEMAIDSYKKSIELAPTNSQTYNNIGNVFKDIGSLDEALAYYRKALEINPDYYVVFSNIFFCVNYHPDYSSEELYAYYRQFEEHVARVFYDNWKPHTNNRDPKRRLKVGYVSPTFFNHSSRYFLEPLLAHHDHSRFEIYAYAQINQADSGTAVYQSYVDHWIPTRGMSDAALAERIRADGIDILIDVAGHTGDNRLLVFARKPAPVSLHWLDFGYTTGLTAIDYYLTDAPTAPPGSDAYFAEKLWRLPTPAYAYRPIKDIGEVGELPASRKGHITFGTLTRSVRINYKLIRAWSEILKAVPDSHLIINSGNFKSEAMQERMAKQFMAHGIERARLEIGHQSPPWDVLRN